MSPPLLAKLKQHPVYHRLSPIIGSVQGLIADFWKDGPDNPFARKKSPSFSTTLTAVSDSAKNNIWSALPGEIAEKMWGDGQLLPCDDKMTEAMIKPLSLGKDVSVLDITAGIGRRISKISKEFQADVMGMDPDAGIAMRGTKMIRPYVGKKFNGIAAYNPDAFRLEKNYDILLAREVFHRVANKENFFRTLSEYASALAQISFTDYILDPENRDKPAVRAWMDKEKGVAPLGLVEMAEAWTKAGFNLRTYDDQTELYKSEIRQGIKRFSIFLGSVKTDTLTKQNLLHQIELWALRLAAIDQGMKFYRIHGIRA